MTQGLIIGVAEKMTLIDENGFYALVTHGCLGKLLIAH